MQNGVRLLRVYGVDGRVHTVADKAVLSAMGASDGDKMIRDLNTIGVPQYNRAYPLPNQYHWTTYERNRE